MHWKQLAMHGLILGAFLFYCFFLAGPLWDRLESIPGESGLHEIKLPGVSTNILGNIDRVDVTKHLLDIRGWAFIKNEDYKGCQTFIVLKSPYKTYVFDTLPFARPDVVEAFKSLNLLGLDQSGFRANIPLRKVGSGEYVIGIYMKKGNIEALVYTINTISKSAKTIVSSKPLSKQQ